MLVNGVWKCQCTYRVCSCLSARYDYRWAQGLWLLLLYVCGFTVISCAVKLMVELCLFTGLGKRKRVMDEKELMIPLELGYVQEAERKKTLMKRLGIDGQKKKVLYTLFFLSSCAMFFSPFLKTQVAERNKTQISSRAVARRSGLLCPVWQETKAVSRCDEGTAASECCSLLTSMIQKQMFWSIPMSSWVNKDYSENHCGRHGLWFIWKNIFANNCNTAHPRCSNKCLCIRICCVLSMLSLQLQSTPLPLPCFLWT